MVEQGRLDHGAVALAADHHLGALGGSIGNQNVHSFSRREIDEGAQHDMAARIADPGPNRSEIDATLHGELGTILGWIEAQPLEGLGNAKRSFKRFSARHPE